MTTEQLPGLQLAVMDPGQPGELPEGLRLAIQYCNIGTTQDRRNFAEDAIRAEHAQRVTLQHHACDLAQRVADLERLNGMHKAAWLAYQPLGDYMQALSMARKLPVGTLGRHLGDVAIERMQAQEARIAELEAERDEWKRIASAYSTQKELSTALEQAKASGRQARKERDDLRAELDCAKWAADVAACSLVSEDCAGYECVGSYIRAVTQQLAKERDELRTKHDELLTALHGIGAALGIPEGDRSPYSVTCGTLERVNRLAEIEAQEPACWAVIDPMGGGSIEYTAAWREACHEHIGDLIAEYDRPDAANLIVRPLFTGPVPAQAVPDASRAEAAGHEHAIGHLGALVEAQRLLLVDVEDICGRDGHGGQFEDGESEIIDRVRAHLATMAAPEAAR